MRFLVCFSGRLPFGDRRAFKRGMKDSRRVGEGAASFFEHRDARSLLLSGLLEARILFTSIRT